MADMSLRSSETDMSSERENDNLNAETQVPALTLKGVAFSWSTGKSDTEKEQKELGNTETDDENNGQMNVENDVELKTESEGDKYVTGTTYPASMSNTTQNTDVTENPFCVEHLNNSVQVENKEGTTVMQDTGDIVTSIGNSNTPSTMDEKLNEIQNREDSQSSSVMGLKESSVKNQSNHQVSETESQSRDRLENQKASLEDSCTNQYSQSQKGSTDEGSHSQAGGVDYRSQSQDNCTNQDSQSQKGSTDKGSHSQAGGVDYRSQPQDNCANQDSQSQKGSTDKGSHSQAGGVDYRSQSQDNCANQDSQSQKGSTDEGSHSQSGGVDYRSQSQDSWTNQDSQSQKESTDEGSHSQAGGVDHRSQDSCTNQDDQLQADRNWELKDNRDKYEYFWKNHSPFSQWYHSKFEVDGTKYMCAEQFMMHRKAILMEDYKTAQKIMATHDPRKQKGLGRQVKHFNQEMWNDNCMAIVEEGNEAKFSQNLDLKNYLFSTFPRTLVEASPLDKIWGIGLAEQDPLAWDESTWDGKNLLGYALTRVRDRMMKKENLI